VFLTLTGQAEHSAGLSVYVDASGSRVEDGGECRLILWVGGHCELQ
jgi:hypothetical protein